MEWELAVFVVLGVVWGAALAYFRARGSRPTLMSPTRAARGYVLTVIVGFIVLLAWGFFGIAKIQNHGWRPGSSRRSP